MRVARALGVLVAAVVVVGGSSALAEASEEGGPALRVPADTLRHSLRCSANVTEGNRAPVLLVPGTTLTPKEDFSWNYERAFAANGRPYCAVTLPNNAMSDMQESAEYVVYAIRTVARMSGHKIGIVGHSQGGMIGRWALKFWPDTRADVDDLVGLAPSNHGTVDADAVCAAPVGCQPAIWQQRTHSNFLTALNSGRETYPEVDYTVVYTDLDEVVTPNLNLASLSGGLVSHSPKSLASSPLRDGGDNVRNIDVQSVCPVHVTEHLNIGSSDAVGYALAIDALDHPGPADPRRIDRSVCTKPFQPGVDPAGYPARFARLGATAGSQLALSPRTPAEPPLEPYARQDHDES